MRVARHIIAGYIAGQLASARTSKTQLAREIAAYLLANGRTGELESLVRDVRVAVAERGQLEVIVVAAHDVPEAAKKLIRRQVQQLYPEAQRIVLTEQRDANVLGGVLLEYPDRQFDATIRAKLNRFKQLTVGEN